MENGEVGEVEVRRRQVSSRASNSSIVMTRHSRQLCLQTDRKRNKTHQILPLLHGLRSEHPAVERISRAVGGPVQRQCTCTAARSPLSLLLSAATASLCCICRS